MSSGSAPSYEQLAVLVAEQAAEIERLSARVAELERRLGLNSRNSSKPPSSDGLGKPPPRSLRKASGRRAGKQPGSPGSTLRQVANPDEIVVHRPSRCRRCRAGLDDAAAAGVGARQVFDLPPLRVRVIEHRLVACRCRRCGTVSTAPAPAGVAAPVQYGPGIAAVVVYLAVRQHIPTARLAELCHEVLGVPMSTGWIASRLRVTATALTGFTDRASAALRAAPLVHFDESGARIDGRTRWIHSASTATLTAYHLDDKRGRAAIDAAGILPAFTGIAVHDFWPAYFTYVNTDHAVCNAHLIRELTGWHDHDPARHQWAQTAIDILLAAHHAVVAAATGADTAGADTAGASSLPPDTIADYQRQWATMITAAYTANPRPAAGRGDRVVALIDRLRTATTEIWRFTHDFRVPFDNNQAERDIRMIKLQAKIGGWRTTQGAHDWLHIRAYVSTVAKNGINVLHALRDTLTGNPWLPPLTPTT